MAIIVRGILAVAAGLGFAVFLILVVEGIGFKIVPEPELPKFDEPGYNAARDDYMANPPLLPTLFYPFSWLVGTAAATAAARRVASGNSPMPGHVAEGLLLLAGVWMLQSQVIPNPIWMWVVGIAAFPIGGYIGASLAAPRVKNSNSDG